MSKILTLMCFPSPDGMKSLSLKNLPSVLKAFITPVPNFTDPKDTSAHFKVLTDYASFLIAQNTKMSDDLRSLVRWGLDYQVLEGVLLTAIQRRIKLPHKYNISKWEWHRDPGYNNHLSRMTVLRKNKDYIPTIPKCADVIHYKGVVCTIDIRQLKLNTIYKSDSVNARFGEFFFVTRDKDGTLVVNFIQGTSTSLPQHPFKYSAVMDIKKGLGLLKEENKNVRLNLICVIDSSSSTVAGCKFIDNRKNPDNKESPKQSKKQSSKKELKKAADKKAAATETNDEDSATKISLTLEQFQQLPGIGPNFKSFIVRADIYELNRFELTATLGETNALTKDFERILPPDEDSHKEAGAPSVGSS